MKYFNSFKIQDKLFCQYFAENMIKLISETDEIMPEIDFSLVGCEIVYRNGHNHTFPKILDIKFGIPFKNVNDRQLLAKMAIENNIKMTIDGNRSKKNK